MQTRHLVKRAVQSEFVTGDGEVLKRIDYNTGAWYTEKGQRITAVQLTHNRIIMVDHDRGLDYMFPGQSHDLTEEHINYAYGHNMSVYPDECDRELYYATVRTIKEEMYEQEKEKLVNDSGDDWPELRDCTCGCAGNYTDHTMRLGECGQYPG